LPGLDGKGVGARVFLFGFRRGAGLGVARLDEDGFAVAGLAAVFGGHALTLHGLSAAPAFHGT